MTAILNNKGTRPFNCADQATRTWLQRTDVCVDLLVEIVSSMGPRLSLADIGCGDQKLRIAIEGRGLPLTYVGYDLLPQTADVRPFDVRRDVLPSGHDIAVMLGVIEYLDDLPAVLMHLSKQVPHLVVSHVVRQGTTYSPEQLKALGWVNHLSADEFQGMLLDCGYRVGTQQMAPDGRTLLLHCQVSSAAGRP